MSPLSRAQKRAQNQRRLKEIDLEGTGITEAQTESVDLEEQRNLSDQLKALQNEKDALERVNTILEKEIEEAAKQKIEGNAETWVNELQDLAEMELDTLEDKLADSFVRLGQTKWKKIQECKKHWTEVWKQHGSPGRYPFRPRARTFAEFLGILRYVSLTAARHGRRKYLPRIIQLLQQDRNRPSRR